MKNFAFIMIVVMACFHCSEGRPPSVSEKVGQTDGRVAVDQTPKTTHTTVPKGAGSQKAYLDPETGELISPPEDKDSEAEQTEAKLPSANADAEEEIVEEKSPVPDGGVMIDLKERFRKPSDATVDKNDKRESGQQTSDTSE